MSDSAITWDASQVSNTVWTAGSTSGWSTPPTMTQLNAGKGINQIIGFVNRKQSQLNGATALSYVTSPDTMTASFVSSIATAINNLRTYIAIGTVSFSINQDRPLTAATIALLQSSLVNWVVVLSAQGQDSAHTLATWAGFAGWNYSSSYPKPAGKRGTGLDGRTHRDRSGIYFNIPNVGTNADAVFSMTANSPVTSGESYLPRAYISSSDDSGFAAGYESNLDILLGDCGSTSGGTIAMSNAQLVARENLVMSMVIGTNNELTSSGGGNLNSNYTINALGSDPKTLTITY